MAIRGRRADDFRLEVRDGLADVLVRVALDQNGVSVGVLELVLDLATAILRIERTRDDAGVTAGPDDRTEGDSVGHVEANSVAGLEAEFSESVGEARDPVTELAVGDRLAGVFDRDRVGVLRDRSLEQVRDVPS